MQLTEATKMTRCPAVEKQIKQGYLSQSMGDLLLLNVL